MSIAYYNGSFSEFNEVRIPLSDRCIFFGDGIYDAAIGRGGGIYLEKEHIDRFFDNAGRINIKISKTKEELSSLLREVINRSGVKQYFLYFQLSRTSGERTHSYPEDSGSSLLITLKPHELPDASKRVDLITADDMRYRMCNVKTLNLLPAVLASKKAEECGCEEAVFIRDGILTECAHSNIFIIKEGIAYTHPEVPHILPGITRRRVLYLCERLGIECREQKFSKEELLSADEILVTSTTKLCVRTGKIDKFRVECKCKRSAVAADAIIKALKDDFGSKC